MVSKNIFHWQINKCSINWKRNKIINVNDSGTVQSSLYTLVRYIIL